MKTKQAESRLGPCIYQADPDAGADHTGDQPCGAPGCHLPRRHPRHELPDVPPEQEAYDRRAGPDS